MTSSNAQALNTKYILLSNLWSKQFHNEIWPVYVTLLKKNFYPKNPKKNYSQAVFNFQRVLCEKESEEVWMPDWTNVNNFVITYLLQVACSKNFIFQ